MSNNMEGKEIYFVINQNNSELVDKLKKYGVRMFSINPSHDRIVAFYSTDNSKLYATGLSKEDNIHNIYSEADEMIFCGKDESMFLALLALYIDEGSVGDEIRLYKSKFNDFDDDGSKIYSIGKRESDNKNYNTILIPASKNEILYIFNKINYGKESNQVLY